MTLREPSRLEVNIMADHAKQLTRDGMQPDAAIREAVDTWEKELASGTYTLRVPLRVVYNDRKRGRA